MTTVFTAGCSPAQVTTACVSVAFVLVVSLVQATYYGGGDLPRTRTSLHTSKQLTSAGHRHRRDLSIDGLVVNDDL